MGEGCRRVSSPGTWKRDDSTTVRTFVCAGNLRTMTPPRRDKFRG